MYTSALMSNVTPTERRPYRYKCLRYTSAYRCYLFKGESSVHHVVRSSRRVGGSDAAPIESPPTTSQHISVHSLFYLPPVGRNCIEKLRPPKLGASFWVDLGHQKWYQSNSRPHDSIRLPYTPYAYLAPFRRSPLSP